MNRRRQGAAGQARRAIPLVVLGGLALGGCGLIVGSPVGDYVFPDAGDDGGVGPHFDGSDENDADATLAADGPSAGDALPAADGPLATDAVSADGAPAADAGGGGCPGSQGPTPIQVTSDTVQYCIDSTEVTNAQYAVFLEAGFRLPATEVPPACEPEGGTMNLTPSVWPAEPGSGSFPVVQVTWCQAYAYCAWAGKRLCGQIGGGATIEQLAANAADSQWYGACSAGGTLTYPYGDTFDAATCGGTAAGSLLANVKTPVACVGGFPGLYNMSGNAWEWIDACDSNNFCYAMGGAFDGTATDLECAGTRPWTKTVPAANIGFRCCGDL